jgi:DNA (cytosine-5)-methyltransferase 1
VYDALDAFPLPNNAPNHEVGLDTPEVIDRLKLIPPGLNYEIIPKGHPLAVKGLISHVYRRLDPARPAYTMIAGGGGGTHGYHHLEPRRLSNRERARLQSFPDDFIFEGGEGRSTYPRIRRQIGNAVPPLGSKVIVQAVVDTLRAAKVPGTSTKAIDSARRLASRNHAAPGK